jgi:hypoxanthine-DNA glycosylase
MLQTHPYTAFVPHKARYLILGSFPAKEAFDPTNHLRIWFYANNHRNQFWSILENVYHTPLKTRRQMQTLFTNLSIAITDIIYQCERKKGKSSDANLTNIVYAVKNINRILNTNPIFQIYFTSHFVETKFRRLFKKFIQKHPQITLITLPSPSPRYTQMTKIEKTRKYTQLLPVKTL